MHILAAFYRIKLSLKLYLQYVFPKFIFLFQFSYLITIIYERFFKH